MRCSRRAIWIGTIPSRRIPCAKEGFFVFAFFDQVMRFVVVAAVCLSGCMDEPGKVSPKPKPEARAAPEALVEVTIAPKTDSFADVVVSTSGPLTVASEEVLRRAAERIFSRLVVGWTTATPAVDWVAVLKQFERCAVYQIGKMMEGTAIEPNLSQCRANPLEYATRAMRELSAAMDSKYTCLGNEGFAIVYEPMKAGLIVPQHFADWFSFKDRFNAEFYDLMASDWSDTALGQLAALRNTFIEVRNRLASWIGDFGLSKNRPITAQYEAINRLLIPGDVDTIRSIMNAPRLAEARKIEIFRKKVMSIQRRLIKETRYWDFQEIERYLDSLREGFRKAMRIDGDAYPELEAQAVEFGHCYRPFVEMMNQEKININIGAMNPEVNGDFVNPIIASITIPDACPEYLHDSLRSQATSLREYFDMMRETFTDQAWLSR